MLAILLGFFLALIYNWTYTGKKANRGQMVYTIVLLCLGGALVWLIVANNLVRAFGLAGALAMIRYRTRMQDPKDTTMVFFAIIIGMACGLHQYNIAIVGSVFIGLVLGVIKLVDIYTSVGLKNGIKEIGLNSNNDQPSTALSENNVDNTQGSIESNDDKPNSIANEGKSGDSPGDQPGSPGTG